MTTLWLGSSVREVPPERTLELAMRVAPALGVTRVTDITRLDSVGVPVFSSIRPSAVPGSLCVNAGKGLRSIEARVGAYMEAIEFSLAEPQRHRDRLELAKVKHLLDGKRAGAVLDFCPIVRRAFDPNELLLCVEARDHASGLALKVPAELVLLPLRGVDGTGKFGSHSNGLASGNSINEAVLHGIFECIERDTRSFQNVHDRSIRVVLDDLPVSVDECVCQIQTAGLHVTLRVLPSSFPVHVFEAVIWDPHLRRHFSLSAGYGCHFVRDIAAVRALTEALQSRLSWIHGGRDDLEEAESRNAQKSAEEQARATGRAHRTLSSWPNTVPYRSLADSTGGGGSVHEMLTALIEALAEGGMDRICVVDLSPVDFDLSVVRVIVPQLEYFDPTSHRIGNRLREFIGRVR